LIRASPSTRSSSPSRSAAGRTYSKSRTARYRFESWDGAAWKELAAGADGSDQPPVRIHAIPRISTSKLRLSLWASTGTPHISEIGVYNEPRT
jgi:alpha-L-fucosidase